MDKNPIAEETVIHWEASGKLHPKLSDYTPDEIQEVHDAIPDYHSRLKAQLQRLYA